MMDGGLEFFSAFWCSGMAPFPVWKHLIVSSWRVSKRNSHLRGTTYADSIPVNQAVGK
jgi:hypothetical protein